MRRVTFSRNFTLSLSRTCRCYCKYCAFATHRAHLYAPDEVERLLDDAARRGAKELLVLTGEKPEVNPEVARAAGRATGTTTSSSYVAWACERALERGMLPHTNLGALLARGARAAARGDRVAGADARVDATRTSSPTRARRPSTRRCGSRRSAPPASCASRSRAGSWSGSARRRRSAIEALEALAEVHAEYGHLQEVILQNFVPHPRYYGAEPAEIADEAQRTAHAADEPAPLPGVGAPRSRSTTCARSCASAAG